MPKYFSMMVSPNIGLSAHGYLICENVPLCRSGYQEYLGRELVGFPGYEEDWNLEPETRYKIYRPPESVTDPEFIRSIEGNTVVDEHPDGSAVTIDNDGEVNCGHVEKVCVGPEVDGEVTLKGDLHIKNQELIDKIRPPGDPDSPDAVRDVSLGYSLKLKRLKDLTIIMYHLRGNHCAVVEKGRAGPLIAIKDAAIEEPAEPEVKPQKEIIVNLLEFIFGKGLKAYAVDASPEEVATAAKEINNIPKAEVEKKPEEKPEPEPEHKEAEPENKPNEEESTESMSPEMSAAIKSYCEGGGDESALMAFLKGGKGPAKDADETLEELQEETHENEPSHPAGEEEQEEKTPAEESDEMSNDADEVDDAGQSVLKQANDSMRALIKANKPVVAAIIAKPKATRTTVEQTMVDSYNTTVKAVNKSGGRAYKALARPKEQVIVDSAKNTVEADICTCFDGVPHRIGLKKHQEHLAQKGRK